MADRPESSSKAGSALEPLDWHFLQCFGERTPGEEIQEGEAPAGASIQKSLDRHPAVLHLRTHKPCHGRQT